MLPIAALLYAYNSIVYMIRTFMQYVYARLNDSLLSNRVINLAVVSSAFVGESQGDPEFGMRSSTVFPDRETVSRSRFNLMVGIIDQNWISGGSEIDFCPPSARLLL